LVAITHSAFDPAAGDGVEHLHRLGAVARCEARRIPEATHAVEVRRRKGHVSRELIGEAADLASAHGIGLAGQRERSLAAPADAARRQVAVDDGVDLVGPLRGLVHALREAGDGVGCGTKQIEEAHDIGSRQPGDPRRFREVRSDHACLRQRILEVRRMRVDVAIVERTQIGEMNQQTAEQRCVHSRCNRKVEIGLLRGRGAAGVDDNDSRAARPLVLDHALKQHWVAPGRVRADQDEKVGLVEILVAAGHGIGAEGALVAGNGGGHAQARIGVHVRRADEAFHQLVGDVIVLGEKLTREIEGDRIGPVPREDAFESGRDPIERKRPVGSGESSVRLPQHGIEQTLAEPERLAERRALGADAAEIGGMIGIAGDRGAAVSVRPGQQAAAHAAIGAGGAHGRRLGPGRVHRPCSRRRAHREALSEHEIIAQSFDR
jgi:hypothetical protein